MPLVPSSILDPFFPMKLEPFQAMCKPPRQRHPICEPQSVMGQPCSKHLSALFAIFSLVKHSISL